MSSNVPDEEEDTNQVGNTDSESDRPRHHTVDPVLNLKLLGPLEARFQSRHRNFDMIIINKTDLDLRFIDDFISFRTVVCFSISSEYFFAARNCGLCRKRKTVKNWGWTRVKVRSCRKKLNLYIGFENLSIGKYNTFIDLRDEEKSAELAFGSAQNDKVKSIYIFNYHIMAEIKPPIQSSFRSFWYTFEKP